MERRPRERGTVGEARVLVGLGANLGDRRGALDGALRALDATPGVRVVAASPWVETEPVGGPPGQPAFLNGVAELAADLDPRALLARLQEVERAFGRRREGEEPNGPRPLDLDLLVHGDARVREPGLTLPHPGLEERSFVLEPLVLLDPQFVLPSGRTAAARLAELRAAGPAPA